MKWVAIVSCAVLLTCFGCDSSTHLPAQENPGQHPPTPSPAAGQSPTTVDDPGGNAKTGTLTGRVELVGGPADVRWPVIHGRVMIAGAARTSVHVDGQGHFSAKLEPGLYSVTATSPEYDSGKVPCEAMHPVLMGSGELSSVEVFCQMR